MKYGEFGVQLSHDGESFDHVVESDDGQYTPSGGFLELGNRIRNQYAVYQVAGSVLEALSREAGEHAVLMVEEDGLDVVVTITKGEENSNIHVRETSSERRFDSGITTRGKSIPAPHSDEQVLETVERYGFRVKNYDHDHEYQRIVRRTRTDPGRGVRP